MPTEVIDKFTGKKKMLYTDSEKVEHYIGRVQSDNVSATERAYAAGWLKRNKAETKKFKKKNPNYKSKRK